jgi:branched-chain amino acid transport system substrate-binding protein
MYLFEVKAPADMKEPWDYLTMRRRIPAAEAFRPMAQDNCPLVRA